MPKISQSHPFVIHYGYSNSYVYTLRVADRVDVIGFASHRPKPKPLSDTYGQIHEHTTGFLYRVGNRYGPADWVFGGYKKSRKESSYNDAITAASTAYRKLGEGRFNAALNLAEFGQTASMVAKRARQLAEAAACMARGDASGLHRALGLPAPSRSERADLNRSSPDRLADNWLEYNYGWKPLVQDVYNAVESYQKGITGKGSRIRVAQHYGAPPPPRRPPGYDPYSYKDPTVGRHVGRSSAQFSGTVTNSRARTLQELGFLNPALLAWEKLPYSFVVDWFLPIGDLLAGLTAGAGLSAVSGSITYDETITSYYGDNHTHSVDRYVVRKPIWPHYAMLAAVLNLTNPMTHWSRMVSSTALLQQRFRR